MLPPRAAVPGAGAALTTHESDVLGYVAQGYANKQVAQARQVSDATIEKHLGHAFGKLGARSRAQAVARAQYQGLLRSANRHDEDVKSSTHY